MEGASVARPLVAADVKDDAAGAELRTEIQVVDEGVLRLRQVLRAFRGEVDEVDAVEKDGKDAGGGRLLAELRQVLWLIVALAPHLRLGAEDLDRLRPDPQGTLYGQGRGTRRGDVGAD